jgi:hypothetical protein
MVSNVGMAILLKKENGRSRIELRRLLHGEPEENHEALYIV